MNGSSSVKDLIILVPDIDMEYSINALLMRHSELGCPPINSDIHRHIHRDAGCCLECHNYLRPLSSGYRYALVVFDHEGCGRERTKREKLEANIEHTLQVNGWRDNCAAIIICPELEAWVWGNTRIVDEVLGWHQRRPPLRRWLQSKTAYWTKGLPKPDRPKEAMESALFEARKQKSPSLYEDLAARVPIDRCEDPSFRKLKRVLNNWFRT